MFMYLKGNNECTLLLFPRSECGAGADLLFCGRGKYGSYIVCFPKSPLILPLSDVTVGFQQVFYSVREADDHVMVCAILTGDTQREVLVNLTTQSGSALG